jgi:hypothetical protein
VNFAIATAQFASVAKPFTDFALPWGVPKKTAKNDLVIDVLMRLRAIVGKDGVADINSTCNIQTPVHDFIFP